MKDPELESLKRRMNKAIEIVEPDKFKRFFSVKR
jgi:hypothetical protein